MTVHTCSGCGSLVEKSHATIKAPKCFDCKQKRTREAAMNYYNLKRRKAFKNGLIGKFLGYTRADVPKKDLSTSK